jgi:hypothetical protein
LLLAQTISPELRFSIQGQAYQGALTIKFNLIDLKGAGWLFSLAKSKEPAIVPFPTQRGVGYNQFGRPGLMPQEPFGFFLKDVDLQVLP